MIKAIKGNFKFSVAKLKIGPSTVFAGLKLPTSPSGRVTIVPDPEWVKKPPVPTVAAMQTTSADPYGHAQHIKKVDTKYGIY